MYIIDLKYKVSLAKIEKYIEFHRIYLDEYYATFKFISSGPKVPRTGGVILAQCDNKAELMKIIKEDPFYKNNLADYSITEFKPNKGSFSEL